MSTTSKPVKTNFKKTVKKTTVTVKTVEPNCYTKKLREKQDRILDDFIKFIHDMFSVLNSEKYRPLYQNIVPEGLSQTETWLPIDDECEQHLDKMLATLEYIFGSHDPASIANLRSLDSCMDDLLDYQIYADTLQGQLTQIRSMGALALEVRNRFISFSNLRPYSENKLGYSNDKPDDWETVLIMIQNRLDDVVDEINQVIRHTNYVSLL